jgi:hypothetical protein
MQLRMALAETGKSQASWGMLLLFAVETVGAVSWELEGWG